MLTRCLQNLAAELQGQLEANKNGEQQAKLATSFKVVIDQLINVSNDPGMIESFYAAFARPFSVHQHRQSRFRRASIRWSKGLDAGLARCSVGG